MYSRWRAPASAPQAYVLRRSSRVSVRSTGVAGEGPGPSSCRSVARVSPEVPPPSSAPKVERVAHPVSNLRAAEPAPRRGVRNVRLRARRGVYAAISSCSWEGAGPARVRSCAPAHRFRPPAPDRPGSPAHALSAFGAAPSRPRRAAAVPAVPAAGPARSSPALPAAQRARPRRGLLPRRRRPEQQHGRRRG